MVMSGVSLTVNWLVVTVTTITVRRVQLSNVWGSSYTLYSILCSEVSWGEVHSLGRNRGEKCWQTEDWRVIFDCKVLTFDFTPHNTVTSYGIKISNSPVLQHKQSHHHWLHCDPFPAFSKYRDCLTTDLIELSKTSLPSLTRSGL